MKRHDEQIVWKTCSTSWTPKELSELKKYAKLRKISFSSYIRSLTLRDRPSRIKRTAKLLAKVAKLATAS